MKELEDISEETKAINKLSKAFELCAKLGIRFSVMDSTLHYANKRLYKECENAENTSDKLLGGGKYPSIAYAQDTELGCVPRVNTHDSMDSCGGW